MISETIENLSKSNGEFLCEAIGNEMKTKNVSYSHIIEPASTMAEIPPVGDAHQFYSIANTLTLFNCPESDEAAFYIGSPDEWNAFEEEFLEWVDMLDEDEQEEALPSWYGSHKVIGEIPASGNYILLVTDGEKAGSIYEFEHDGWEFIKLGGNLNDFILNAIEPSPEMLSTIASHMRFVACRDEQQWWIKELRFKSGETIINED